MDGSERYGASGLFIDQLANRKSVCRIRKGGDGEKYEFLEFSQVKILFHYPRLYVMYLPNI